MISYATLYASLAALVVSLLAGLAWVPLGARLTRNIRSGAVATLAVVGPVWLLMVALLLLAGWLTR